MVHGSWLIWERLLFTVLGLCLYELAAESSFYLLEFFLVLLFFSFLIEERSALACPIASVRKGLCLLHPTGWIWTMLGLYIAVDIVSASYSVFPQGFWEKYRVVLLMLGLSALFLWSSRREKAKRLQLFYKIICAAGIAAAAISIINVAFLMLYPILYGRRLSLRLDYNMFSEVVLMGLIAGTYLLKDKRPLSVRFFFLYLLCAPVIILSSSRRNTVFLGAFAAWVFLREIFLSEKQKRFRIVGGWIALLMGIVCMTGLLQVFLDFQYEKMQKTEIPIALESADSALERYEQAAKQQGSSKRMLIWSEAVQKQAEYSKKEKLFGKGFGYDRLLYQITDNKELLQAYSPQSRTKLSAHCFILADLLNGGYIQMVLGLAVWGGIAFKIFALLIKKREGTMFFAITLGIVLINNLISNRYGFLYDKYFWLLLCGLTVF